MQEQFHQFFASPPPSSQQTRSSPNSLPLSFSLLHGSLPLPLPPPSSSPYPIFDTNYPPHPHPLQPPTHHHLHHHMLQYPPVAVHSKSVKEELDLGQSNWSHDEVLALFRVRSALEDWFPDFTWEHVSRY